jgi:glycosyltransferase involved in cell wall biosynthesis
MYRVSFSLTTKNFEIVIVEDPSFVGSIIDAFEDKKIRYARNQKHLGLSKSRNNGIARMLVPKLVKNGFNSFSGVRVGSGRLNCKWK